VSHQLINGHNQRPVVGILSQPYDGGDFFYIAASYVKWLESSGARSIPIPYDADEDLVSEIVSQINGVLFPGGAANLPSAAKYIWKLAIQRNMDGDYFPIWGTCLGFEFMLMLSADKGEAVLESGFVAENISLPLYFPDVEDVRRTQGVFSSLSQIYSSPHIRQILSTENLTMNNHKQGISPQAFMSDHGVTSMFHATSTNWDAHGRPFISTIESFIMPFYATQYHPEKNNFEYGTLPDADVPYENINHSPNAIYISQHLSNFFVSQTRKNSSGKYEKVDRHPLIYKYNMTEGIKFEQIYLIPSAETWDIEYRLSVNEISFLRGSMLKIK
jgi:gamma-glutamyl hydrolase